LSLNSFDILDISIPSNFHNRFDDLASTNSLDILLKIISHSSLLDNLDNKESSVNAILGSIQVSFLNIFRIQSK